RVAAVAGAERAGVAAVEERVLVLRGLPALLQVLQRTVAPVLADRVGKRLAVTGGAVEVDHHHRIALPRIGLRVPAVAPAVAEAALRTSVDQECDGVLLALFVVPRLDHVTVHSVVVPALERELFELTKADLGQHLRSTRGDRAFRRTVDSADEQLGATDHAGAGERQRAIRELDGTNAAVADDLGDATAVDMDCEQRVLAGVLRGYVQRFTVVGNHDAVGGPVPRRGNRA